MKRFKKLLLGLIAFATMAILCAVCASADPFDYRELADGTIEITECYISSDENPEIIIPSTISGKKVTSIGYEAFANYWGNAYHYSGYNSITIPDTVTNIGHHAFANTGIRSIKLPSGLKTIGTAAFYACDSLTTVTIPGSVTTIGAYAFEDCNNLESVVIANGVKTIGDNAFYECSKLKSVTIPASVKSIGNWIVYYCSDELKLNIDCKNTVAKNYAIDNGIRYGFVHNFNDWTVTKAATCTAEGSRYKTCADCKAKYTQAIPKIAHKYATAWTIDKAATCTTAGSKSHHCTVCGGKGSVTVIDALGHKYVDTVVNPTYTARGYTLHKCSVCAYSFKDSYKPALTLASISNLKVGGRASNAIRLNWSEHTGANGYIIEQYKGDKWVQLATIPSNATTTYRISGLSASTAYKFRVQAYKTITDGTAKSSYAEITAATNPTTVTGFKVGGRSSDAIRLNWTKNTTASGYIIEMYNGSAWIRVGKITGNATTTYRISGLSASTVYKFRVQAYKNINGGATRSGYTTLSARTNPKAVSGFKTGTKTASAIRLNWNKNTGADGYVLEIYKGGKWVQLTTIASNATTTYRISGLAKNTTYKIRIKAYKMSGSTALYSGYTTISGKTTA